MKYDVTIGDRTIEVELGGSTIRVDGHPVEAELVAVTDTTLRHLLVDGRSHAIHAEPGRHPGAWRMTQGGRVFEISVLDERTRAILELSGDPEPEGDKQIRAPMPGLVVRIDVEPGDRIEAGQGLIVVEAMKMENELKAPAGGTVARIEVAPGQAVEKGSVLVVLE
jgi:biotin carboxyl carrier protein